MFVNKRLVLKNLGLSIKYKTMQLYKKWSAPLFPNASCQRSTIKKNKLQNGFLNVCVGAGLFTIMCTYISGKLIKSF